MGLGLKPLQTLFSPLPKSFSYQVGNTRAIVRRVCGLPVHFKAPKRYGHIGSLEHVSSWSLEKPGLTEVCCSTLVATCWGQCLVRRDPHMGQSGWDMCVDCGFKKDLCGFSIMENSSINISEKCLTLECLSETLFKGQSCQRHSSQMAPDG